MTNEPINEFLDGIEGDPIWAETEALEELEYAPSLSIEEVRLRVLELVLMYGKPMSGSTDSNPVVVREKIRELARFFEEYIFNG